MSILLNYLFFVKHMFCISDDSMDRDELIRRLKSLPDDINANNEGVKKAIQYYLDAAEDKDKFIKDAYASDYAPFATSAVTGFSRDADDRMEIYEKFIEGFDSYLIQLVEEYLEIVERKKEARKLLTLIMNLPPKHTKIIYYIYLKHMSVDELCEKLYMSRATFYRYKGQAVKMLIDGLQADQSPDK